MQVPESIVDAVCTIAELGASQIVTKCMPSCDVLEDAAEDSDSGWTILQSDDEDWMALFWHKPDVSPETDALLAKVRAASDEPRRCLELINAMPADGAWIIQVQCDYKRLFMDITAPHAESVVNYVFSIRNDELVMSKDTLKSDVLNTKCEQHVQRQYEMMRIRRTDPDINENVLQLFPRP